MRVNPQTLTPVSGQNPDETETAAQLTANEYIGWLRVENGVVRLRRPSANHALRDSLCELE